MCRDEADETAMPIDRSMDRDRHGTDLWVFLVVMGPRAVPTVLIEAEWNGKATVMLLLMSEARRNG